jgi:hypothetical protein
MANVELVLALEQQLDLVPLRRGWWVAQTVARRVRVAPSWGRMIGRLPGEGMMRGGGGTA